jgi:integrase
MSVKLRARTLRDGRQSLYLDIYQDGTRTYDYLNLYLTKDNKGGKNKESKLLAEQLRAKRELALNQNEHGVAIENHRKTSFIAYFEAQTKKRRGNTAASWKCALNDMKAYAATHGETFAHVTPQWLEGLQTFLLDRVAQNTAYLRYNMIKAALRQAVRDDIISSSPATKIKGISRKDTHRSYLDQVELEKLAAEPCRNPEVKRAFLFSCMTGLRLSDVRALRWRNITRDRIQLTQQKTTEVHYLDLTDAIRSMLPAVGEADELVFQLPSTGVIEKVLKQWCGSAKITKHVTFHVARHTFATLLLTLGGDIYTVSKLLGHTNLATTQVYAKIVDAKKRATLGLLPIMALQENSQ